MAEFIRKYLKQPDLSKVTYDDLINFLKEGIEENLNLEYKPRGMLVDKDNNVLKKPNPKEIIGFSQLAKLVAGFANSAGGLLVLGVKEKPEKYKGKTVKMRPGPISPLPPSITREMIEHNLEAKIQFPIHDVTILALRKSTRSKNCIYLIDVPQSIRAPHRVNELYYYQRHNFSTVEMQHFQISDLFGKRLHPDLDFELSNISVQQKKESNNEIVRKFSFDPVFHNRGRSVAKYTTCLLVGVHGSEWVNAPREWVRHADKNVCQYETKSDRVIYPDVSFSPGQISFGKKLKTLEEEPEDLILRVQLYADEMVGRTIIFVIDGKSGEIKDINRVMAHE